jgi:hypothetical protein
MFRAGYIRRCTTTSNLACLSSAVVGSVAAPAMQPQWGFRTKSQGFVPMSDADSVLVERAFDPTGTRSTPMPIVANKVMLSNGHVYDFVFDRQRMTQTNTSTNKCRRLQRAMIPVAQTTTSPPTSSLTGGPIQTPSSAAVSGPASSVLRREHLADYKYRSRNCLDNFSPFCALYANLSTAGLPKMTGLEEAAHEESASCHNGNPTAKIKVMESSVLRHIRKRSAKFGPVGKDIALLEMIGKSFRRCVRQCRQHHTSTPTPNTVTAPPRSPGDTLKDELHKYRIIKRRPRYPLTALSETLNIVGWKVQGLDELARKELEQQPKRVDRTARRLVQRRIRFLTSKHGALGKDIAVLELILVSFRKAVRLAS